MLARGYGRLEITRPDPVQPTTVFHLGSVSKQMLAALVVALADEKRFALDDPVIGYLPELSLLSDSIRIHHLLSHTSGIRELFMMPEAGPGFDDLNRSRTGLDSLVRRIAVDFPAGARWSYSNTNYSLLAMLVERVTGTSYDAALRTRFFQPLGWYSFRHCSSIPAAADAQGHEWVNERNATAAPENMNWIRGDGGLCANAIDLARWTRLLHSGRVLSTPAYARMIAPTLLRDGHTADYGFGLAFVGLDDVTRIAHGGAMRGFTATAAYYPDSAFTVVVLTNRGNVRTESIERALGRRLHGLPPSGPPNVFLSIDQRSRYLGTYDVGVFDVRVVDRGARSGSRRRHPVPPPPCATWAMGDSSPIPNSTRTGSTSPPTARRFGCTWGRCTGTVRDAPDPDAEEAR